MRKLNYAAHVNAIMPHSTDGLELPAGHSEKYAGELTISGGQIVFDSQNIEAYLSLRNSLEPGMPKPRRRDPKSQALARDGALNPHPEAVRDPLFTSNPFFDPKDLVQVRYEMVRRHDAEGASIGDVAASFGVSRPTFYKAQSTLAASGLAGLVPRARGPKGGHKISAEVLAFIINRKADQPELTTPLCLAAIENQFGIKVHRRSLERALARKKKSLAPIR